LPGVVVVKASVEMALDHLVITDYLR